MRLGCPSSYHYYYHYYYYYKFGFLDASDSGDITDFDTILVFSSTPAEHVVPHNRHRRDD